VVAHEFHLTNLNSMAYLYQVWTPGHWCTQGQPPSCASLTFKFSKHMKTFQKQGTAIILKSVKLKPNYYQEHAMIPSLLHNLYWLCTTFAQALALNRR
jgi:hypothetical protein